jgi:hypothetical protein
MEVPRLAINEYKNIDQAAFFIGDKESKKIKPSYECQKAFQVHPFLP